MNKTGAVEIQAATAFSLQSAVFDQLYSPDPIIQYKRQRVRTHIEKYLQPGSRLLELNCGTGEDALYFAGKGFSIHATDISQGMLDKLEEKKHALSQDITTQICSFNHLEQLHDKGPFDHIFSNFGGLNCTPDLDKVLASLDPLLKPGGAVTLVIISKFCLWETLLLFKGKFATAFRRFFSASGRKAVIEGSSFRCWYYSPAYVRKHISKKYIQVGLEGLCTIVPPSYMEGFAAKHPKLYSRLCKLENRYKDRWPWRVMGDYFIISLKKRPS
jgi:ubiquinone/menaquinone biosynthesis C-methylase UbiE